MATVKFTVTEQSGNTLTDYAVRIDLDSTINIWGSVQPDGSDIYFTDASGNPLYYWIERFDASAQTATIWVKIPSLPANGSVTITMYYGGAGNPYTSYHDGSQVFLVFDDFTGPTLDSKWTAQGGITVQSITDSIVNISTSSNPEWYEAPVNYTGSGWAVRARGEGQTGGSWRNFHVFYAVDSSGRRYLDFNAVASDDAWLRYTTGPGVRPSDIARVDYTYNDNTFYTIEVFVKSDGSITLYVNDAQVVSGYAPSTLSPLIGFGASVSRAGFDWILIRPYVNPEPTVTVVPGQAQTITASDTATASEGLTDILTTILADTRTLQEAHTGIVASGISDAGYTGEARSQTLHVPRASTPRAATGITSVLNMSRVEPGKIVEALLRVLTNLLFDSRRLLESLTGRLTGVFTGGRRVSDAFSTSIGVARLDTPVLDTVEAGRLNYTWREQSNTLDTHGSSLIHSTREAPVLTTVQNYSPTHSRLDAAVAVDAGRYQGLWDRTEATAGIDAIDVGTLFPLTTVFLASDTVTRSGMYMGRDTTGLTETHAYTNTHRVSGGLTYSTLLHGGLTTTRSTYATVTGQSTSRLGKTAGDLATNTSTLAFTGRYMDVLTTASTPSPILDNKHASHTAVTDTAVHGLTHTLTSPATAPDITSRSVGAGLTDTLHSTPLLIGVLAADKTSTLTASGVWRQTPVYLHRETLGTVSLHGYRVDSPLLDQSTVLGVLDGILAASVTDASTTIDARTGKLTRALVKILAAVETRLHTLRHTAVYTVNASSYPTLLLDAGFTEAPRPIDTRVGLTGKTGIDTLASSDPRAIVVDTGRTDASTLLEYPAYQGGYKLADASTVTLEYTPALNTRRGEAVTTTGALDLEFLVSVLDTLTQTELLSHMFTGGLIEAVSIHSLLTPVLTRVLTEAVASSDIFTYREAVALADTLRLIEALADTLSWGIHDYTGATGIVAWKLNLLTPILLHASSRITGVGGLVGDSPIILDQAGKRVAGILDGTAAGIDSTRGLLDGVVDSVLEGMDAWTQNITATTRDTGSTTSLPASILHYSRSGTLYAILATRGILTGTTRDPTIFSEEVGRRAGIGFMDASLLLESRMAGVTHSYSDIPRLTRRVDAGIRYSWLDHVFPATLPFYILTRGQWGYAGIVDPRILDLVEERVDAVLTLTTRYHELTAARDTRIIGGEELTGEALSSRLQIVFTVAAGITRYMVGVLESLTVKGVFATRKLVTVVRTLTARFTGATQILFDHYAAPRFKGILEAGLNRRVWARFKEKLKSLF